MLPKFRAVLYRGAYYAAWRENGVIRRQALRTKDHSVAEQALREFAEQYEIANRPEIITVEFVWKGYNESIVGKPAARTMQFEARAVLGFFGSIAAESVSEKGCADYCSRRRAEGRKDGTIWTELGRLRSALKWAERKNLIAKAPAIYRPAMSPPRDFRLTREQASLFLSSCITPHIRLCVILAMTTGARIGALLGLTWDRVNFHGKTIDLSDPTRPKTKKGRPVVPINRTLMAALTGARAGATTPYVIEWDGKPVKSVKRGLQAAGRRAGLPWVTAHVFRHSAACWMAQDGVDLRKIAEMLGHADSRTTEKIYSRFTPDFLRDAAEALEMDVCGVAPCENTRAERTSSKRNGAKT